MAREYLYMAAAGIGFLLLANGNTYLSLAWFTVLAYSIP